MKGYYCIVVLFYMYASAMSFSLNGKNNLITMGNNPSLSKNDRPFVSEIKPVALTHWGDWGVAEFCPDMSFARDYELKIEPSNESADTAMNAIKLYCYYNISGVELEAGQITSTVGPFGDWTGKVSCGDKGDFLRGAQFKSEPDQGVADDTAGNSVNMECTDGSILEPEGGPWGEWTHWELCPENTAICGVKTRVEPDITYDDT